MSGEAGEQELFLAAVPVLEEKSEFNDYTFVELDVARPWFVQFQLF